MKKITFLLLLLSITTILYSQSNFHKGFRIGYENGYCQDIPNCLPPLVPIAPILETYERLDSYDDGYNRGFKMGLEENKKSEQLQINRGYVTSSSEPQEYVQGLNLSLAERALLITDKRISENKLKKESLIFWAENLLTNSTDNDFSNKVKQILNQVNGIDSQVDLVKFSKMGPELDILKSKMVVLVNAFNEKRLSVKEPISTDAPSKNNEVAISKSDEITFKYLKEAEILTKNNDLNAAIKKMDTVLARKPIKEFYALRGMLYFYLNKPQEAIKDFTLSINMKNPNTKLFYYRGIMKQLLNDYDGANFDYNMVISPVNSHKLSRVELATAYNNKGYNLVKLGNNKDALELINKALGLSSDQGFIWDSRGELNYKIGKYKECVSDMDNSIRLSPLANSYLYRGLAKIKLGLKSQGCLDLSKAGEMGDSEAYDYIKKHCK